VTAPADKSVRQHLRNAGFVALTAAAAIFVIMGNQRQPAPGGVGDLPTVTAPAPSETLRIGLYNVHGGRTVDGADNLAIVAGQARDARLDVLALNEVYGAWRGDDYAKQLGQSLGLAALFAPAERRWGRDSFGNGLLTRFPLTEWRREPLPRVRGNGFRTLLTATLGWGQPPLTLLVTHLDREGDQAEQMRIVAEEFLAIEGPAVLLGDLNLAANDPSLAALLAERGVVDALAAGGSPLPSGSIEWILVRGLDVTEAGVVRSEASDHPLVWVELRPAGQDSAAKMTP
jgi:endonuclease/exonuclease/phosphatase family metal-dependent hydrolase